MKKIAIKFSFGEDGSVKKDENYKLSVDDLSSLENAEEEDEEDEEDRVAELESEMEPQKLRLWLQVKSQGKSIDEFLAEHGGARKNVTAPRSERPKGHSRQPSKSTLAKRRMGRQETLVNCRDKEAIRRTYIIEIENIKKLEEIKVFHYSDEIIQFSEIINDAIEHYYECLKGEK